MKNLLYTRRYEMLVRVRDFGQAHRTLFPSDSLAGKAFSTVARTADDLEAHSASRESGRGSTREGTTSKAIARDSLREDLDAIIRTARAIAVTVPGMDDKFRPPRGTDQQLLTTARTFARDVAPLAPAFIEHYLPANFLADLEADIQAFEEAMRAQEAGKGAKAAADAAIDDAMEAAAPAITQLDALVPNRIGNDAALLALWERARRVDYPPRRAQAEAPAANEAAAT